MSRPCVVGGGDPLRREVGGEVGRDQARSPGARRGRRRSGRRRTARPGSSRSSPRWACRWRRPPRPCAARRWCGRRASRACWAACLDGGAVHHRVAVGQADLDDVAAGVDHRGEGGDPAVDVGEAGRQVADERRAALVAGALEGGGSMVAWRACSRVAEAEPAQGGLHVLVTAAGEVHQHEAVGAQLAGEVVGAGQRVGRLDRRDDPLLAGQHLAARPWPRRR